MPPTDRTVSGTAVVLVAAFLAVAFVVFLLTGGRTLHERTLEAAPPLAPHEVARGELGGAQWTATAHEPEAETPCLQIELAGTQPMELCTGVRGGDLRVLGALEHPDGDAALLAGIVDPRVVALRLEQTGGMLEADPSYVDFGFPLGFFVVELPAGAEITRVVALDRDGEVRATHDCAADGTAPGAGCALADPLYSGGQG